MDSMGLNVTGSKLAQLCELTAQVTKDHVAPSAEQVDRECLWPAHSMQAFAEAGLMGLQVPERLGGHGQGLLGLSMLRPAMRTWTTNTYSPPPMFPPASMYCWRFQTPVTA